MDWTDRERKVEGNGAEGRKRKIRKKREKTREKIFKKAKKRGR